MYAYIKMMDEFSTDHVRSVSRFGYCMSTLEIAMERILTMSLRDLLEQQRNYTVAERSQSFCRNL